MAAVVGRGPQQAGARFGTLSATQNFVYTVLGSRFVATAAMGISVTSYRIILVTMTMTMARTDTLNPKLLNPEPLNPQNP